MLVKHTQNDDENIKYFAEILKIRSFSFVNHNFQNKKIFQKNQNTVPIHLQILGEIQ